MEKITLEKFNDLTYHLRIMMAFLHNRKVQDSDYLNGIISDLNSKGITRFLSEEDFNQSDIKDNYISYDDYRDTLLEQYEDMYIQYQNELLSYDLSNIPYKNWSGVTLIFEGKLDLSETKGNFDFSIINLMGEGELIAKNCNVENLINAISNKDGTILYSNIDIKRENFDERIFSHYTYDPNTMAISIDEAKNMLEMQRAKRLS